MQPEQTLKGSPSAVVVTRVQNIDIATIPHTWTPYELHELPNE